MELLKNTYYFQDAPLGLIEALADKMTRRLFQAGDIYVKEGEEIVDILMLESGEFVRTKEGLEIDRLRGRGRVSGLLHSLEIKDSRAFATVTATKPCVAYTIQSKDFCAILEEPTYSRFLFCILSREIRAGTKSVRSLMRKVKSQESISSKNGSSIFRVLCYDTASWVKDGFAAALEKEKDIIFDYTADRLNERTATFAAGYDGICIFVNDSGNAKALQILSQLGVKLVCLRCAGFDRVDLSAASIFSMTVVRVPAYSPYAVAEMAVSLLMAVNRKIIPAHSRIHNNNFSLDGSIMGMDIHGKTVGVLGTGKIGRILCSIIAGFGVNLLCFDIFEHDDIKKLGGTYVSKEEIYKQSDVIFLMMPLLPATHHTINAESIAQMKEGVLIINTSRGGLVDTRALLDAVRSGKVGGVGIDVYENEEAYFFQDWSAKKIQDPDLLAILGEKNVIMTAHQAFFTREAIGNIVDTTIENIKVFQSGSTESEHPNACPQ